MHSEPTHFTAASYSSHKPDLSSRRGVAPSVRLGGELPQTRQCVQRCDAASAPQRVCSSSCSRQINELVPALRIAGQIVGSSVGAGLRYSGGCPFSTVTPEASATSSSPSTQRLGTTPRGSIAETRTVSIIITVQPESNEFADFSERGQAAVARGARFGARNGTRPANFVVAISSTEKGCDAN